MSEPGLNRGSSRLARRGSCRAARRGGGGGGGGGSVMLSSPRMIRIVPNGKFSFESLSTVFSVAVSALLLLFWTSPAIFGPEETPLPRVLANYRGSRPCHS